MLVLIESVTRSVIVTHWACGGIEDGQDNMLSGLTQYSTAVSLVQLLATVQVTVSDNSSSRKNILNQTDFFFVTEAKAVSTNYSMFLN